MKRKINMVGRDTLTVSLPKEWAVKNGIRKGEEVDVDLREHSLTVFGKGGKADRVVEISANEDPEATFRLLRASYFQGADEIKINFKDKKSMSVVEKHMDYFIGFEIIERTSTYWLLRGIADIREGEFEKVLKRLFNLAASMGRDLYDGFSTGRLNIFPHIYSLEATVNKLYIFCARYTNSTGWRHFRAPTLYYILVQKIESIADAFTAVSKYYNGVRGLKASRQTLKLMGDVLDYFEVMQDFYYNFDFHKFSSIVDSKNQLAEKASRLYRSASSKELLLISKLIDTIILIWDASSTIFDVIAAENPKSVGISPKGA